MLATPFPDPRHLEEDITLHGLGEITRAYTDKMLLAALQEAQTVVRSYDTKAQIVGVGYILALNLILHFGDLLPTQAHFGPLFFAVVWGVVILPIVQFGQVLYPSRTRAEKQVLAKTSSGSEQRIYYVDPAPSRASATWWTKPCGPIGPRSLAQNCSRYRVLGSSSRHASGAAL